MKPISAMTEKQYRKYIVRAYRVRKRSRKKEDKLRQEVRKVTLTRKQYHAEKQCYAEYVYWKMELEATMRRMREFIYRW